MSLFERLSNIQEELISAVIGDVHALKSFETRWSILQHDLQSAFRADKMDPETTALAYSTASTVSVITQAFLDLQTKSQAIATDLKHQLEGLFGQLSLSNQKSSPNESHIPPSHPLYIEPSYSWLLKNLHNPYPTKEVREEIANSAGCHSRDIDGWFVDARKRMGWNSLRKARFSNKRRDIINAATRYFVKADPKCPLEPTVELAFATMESNAHELYSEKFVESSLAAKLDVAVKDMTPEMKAHAKEEEKRQKQLERRSREKRVRDAKSYPSPERSPGTTPEPLSSPSLDYECHLPIIDSSTSKRKRRTSDVESVLENEGPQHKRCRLELAALRDPGSTSLPSPAMSSHEVTEEFCPSTSPPSPVPSVTSVVPRKRRLSYSENQSTSKRLRRQTASDPFPMPIGSPSFDEWYQGTFIPSHLLSSIPPAVSVEAPDATAALDIEIYNFSSSPFESGGEHHGLGSEHCESNLLVTDSIQPALTYIKDPSDSITSMGSIGVAETPTVEHAYNENDFSWFDLNNFGFSDPIPHDQVSLTSIDESVAFALDHVSADESGTSCFLAPSLPVSRWSTSYCESILPPNNSHDIQIVGSEVSGLDTTTMFTCIPALQPSLPT